jgi:hypothetical protein
MSRGLAARVAHDVLIRDEGKDIREGVSNCAFTDSDGLLAAT